MPQHAPNTAHNRTQHATDTASDMSPPVRATVEEAAKILDTSENAVRKRIERGTLASEKVDGVRYVLLLDSDMPQHAKDTADDTGTDRSGDLALMRAHLDSLQEQVSYLKAVIQTRDEELRRKDHLLAAMTERLPELEPPREAREAPQTPSDDPYLTPAPPTPETPVSGAQPKRSWWRALFGAEG
jgi:hypothetical protein